MHCHHRQWTGDRRRPNLSQTAMSNGSDGGIDVAQVAMWRTEKGWSKGKQNKNKKYGKERTRERGYNLVLEMLHESHTHTRGCALSFLLSPCGIVALCNVRTIFIIIVITIRNGWKTNRIDQDMVWRAVAFVAKAHAADVHLIAFWPASVACAAHNSARFANLN